MRNEDQNVEYKKSWQDEYLKWICGFANADGGRMFIGILDDKRGNEVVGVEGWKKLLEDIPNQMRDTMGMIADVKRKLYVGNVGSLPETWTLKKLMGKHPSRPYNPTIAGCVYLTGKIETWGRGVEKVMRECRKHGCPMPVYDISHGEPGDILVRIDAAPDAQTTSQTTSQTTLQIDAVEGLGDVTQKVLEVLMTRPSVSVDAAAKRLHMKKDAFTYHVRILRKVVGLRHTGGTKKGRWEMRQGLSHSGGSCVTSARER